MNIQQSTAASPANNAAAESGSTAATKDDHEATLDSAAFSKLLKGANEQEVNEPTPGILLTQSVSVPTELGAELFNLQSLLGQMSSADALAVSLESVSSEKLALGADSLVVQPLNVDSDSLLGQTLRLDQQADISLRDGSHVWMLPAGNLNSSATFAAVGGAQPNVAVGQQIATVAAGVQQAVGTLSAFARSNEPVSISTAAKLVDEVAQETSNVAADMQHKDSSGEGRFTLQGAWTLNEPQAAPSAMMQRLVGQIEHWALSSSGVQPKVNERTESSKALLDSENAMSQGHSSGTRLTENAVRELQQSQAAFFETSQEAPAEDMRFWLQGKQQRAELTLDRDGQPVRVQVAVNGNEAHVIFRSDQQQTRDLLDASLAQLREMLAQQGVQLQGVSVQSQGDSQQPDSQSQHSDNGAAQQSGVQHVRIAVPEGNARESGRSQGLDVYA